jgi:hypothetical protein
LEGTVTPERSDLAEPLVQDVLGQVLAVLWLIAEAPEEPAHPWIVALEDQAAVVLDADPSLKLLDRALERGIVFGALSHFFYLIPGARD